MTDEELIAEYIKKNGVTKIPRGQSSFAGYVWCDEKNDLVLNDPEATENWNKSLYRARKSVIDKLKREKRARLDETVDLVNAGKNTSQIATHFGIGEAAVLKYLAELRKEGRLPPVCKSRPGGIRDSAELDRIFAEHYVPGASVRSMSRKMGMNERSVSRRIKKLRAAA